jgi:hypothetical protein
VKHDKEKRYKCFLTVIFAFLGFFSEFGGDLGIERRRLYGGGHLRKKKDMGM